MPKANPTAGLAARLVEELADCRAAGGEWYPVPVARLAQRLEPPEESAVVLKAVGDKAFAAKAVVASKGRLGAPAALAEDAFLLAASPLTLEFALNVMGQKGAPPWTPKSLSMAVQPAVRDAFLEHLHRQLNGGELPSFAVRTAKGTVVRLHHRDQPPPPPKEAQDAERLLDLLRRSARSGGGPEPVALTDLAREAALPAAAFKKAVKQPAFLNAVIEVKPNDVFAASAGDEFERFVTGALLPRLLNACARPGAHAFSVKELVARIKGKGRQQAVAAQLDRPDLTRDLPPGVGCVLVSDGRGGGQHAFFPLEHLRAASTVADRTRPAAPVPISPDQFAAAFDAAFARIDRERGSNNFVSLVDLRAALPDVPREAFDAGLNRLRRERRYVLSSDERSDGVTPEQQEAAIREEGEFLLHVSRGRQ